jgi:hypothetical protein
MMTEKHWVRETGAYGTMSKYLGRWLVRVTGNAEEERFRGGRWEMMNKTE